MNNVLDLRSVVVLQLVEGLVAREHVGHALGVEAREQRVEEVLAEAQTREHQRLAALVDAIARAAHRRAEALARQLALRVRDGALDPLEAALRLLVPVRLQMHKQHRKRIRYPASQIRITLAVRLQVLYIRAVH